jgi:hypothetical protein
VADSEEITIPIRLVPLATAGGKPKKIIRGKVISDPPPAMVFINPAKTPAKNKSPISYSSMTSNKDQK